MSDQDIVIPSVEADEISDLDLGPSLLFPPGSMDGGPFVLQLARDIHGPGARVGALDERYRRRNRELGTMELAVDEIRRDFLIGACTSSIEKRLDLVTQIHKEMEAYERATEKIRNDVFPKYVKAHKKKDTNAGNWEKVRADMHDALIPASKSLQELEVGIFKGSSGTMLTSTVETL
jgi:hypothetical protein